MSPLNLQHHRQPPPSPPPPPSPTSTSTGALPTFSSRLHPRPTSPSQSREPPSRTANGFFRPSHFYIHLNPSILNDGYFLRATVWIFIPSTEEERAYKPTGRPVNISTRKTHPPSPLPPTTFPILRRGRERKGDPFKNDYDENRNGILKAAEVNGESKGLGRAQWRRGRIGESTTMGGSRKGHLRSRRELIRRTRDGDVDRVPSFPNFRCLGESDCGGRMLRNWTKGTQVSMKRR